MKNKILNCITAVVPIALVGTIIGTAIYTSQPECQEFIRESLPSPTYLEYVNSPKDKITYRLSVNKDNISVGISNKPLPTIEVVDNNKDFHADYTKIFLPIKYGPNTFLKRKLLLEEVAIFNEVVSKSKKFGEE